MTVFYLKIIAFNPLQTIIICAIRSISFQFADEKVTKKFST